MSMQEVEITEEAIGNMKTGARKVTVWGELRPNSTGVYCLCNEVGTNAKGILNIKGEKAQAAIEAILGDRTKCLTVRCINDEGVCFLKTK